VSVTYEIFEVPNESGEELINRLYEEIRELEMKHYTYSNRSDKEDDMLTSIENELNAKKTEYIEAGGSFD
tara:strand:+ start:794 stop:1003 length:210 start_codon:yes stop_codon:yes gene_type:complete